MSCPKCLGNPKSPSWQGGTLAFLKYLAHEMEQPNVTLKMRINSKKSSSNSHLPIDGKKADVRLLLKGSHLAPKSLTTTKSFDFVIGVRS